MKIARPGRFRLVAALLAATLATGGCEERRPDDQPVDVSVIGGMAGLADPNRSALDLPKRVLLGATAQGLVRFDANGQIEAGLAKRWIVIDNGRSYIFRLDEAQWPDGSAVQARDVVHALRGMLAARSHNALLPFLAAIDEAVEMTPQVVEIRLKRPRPDLLKLFAQPEMAIFRGPAIDGSGPFRIAEDVKRGLLLRPPVDRSVPGDGEGRKIQPQQTVRMRGESVARALARFVLHRSDLVLGGSVVDWPLLAAAGVAPANIRLDPARGLFGLAVVRREGFLADAANRTAISAAIDRAALTAAFTPEWQPIEQILPEMLDSASAPAMPDWSTTALEQRRQDAQARVAMWRHANPGGLWLRIALPEGPGANRLWRLIASTLVQIGISSQRVAMDADADLRLVDAVAPYDSGRWFLATGCIACSSDVAALIDAARDAPDLDSRAKAIAAADVALTADATYIPLAQPLRWSAVALRLPQWQGTAARGIR